MGKDIIKGDKAERKLFERVVAVLEQARSQVVRTVNSQMVLAYWHIGCLIVEEEQKGENRAEYGQRIIEGLSRRLTEKYGKGFSTTNLWDFRRFYMVYADRRPENLRTLYGELVVPEKLHTVCGDSRREPFADISEVLSWSHYRLLMRVENDHARSFYEIEAARNKWSTRELERQIASLLFERLLKSRDKKGVMELARDGNAFKKPLDIIKDPYVLEFLDLPESHRLMEGDLEEALITHLQEFLLELGSGFAFVARQKRLTLEGDHFYADLVFYHIKLKCYVIIDLKVAKLTHADLGQMQMYVHYFDREIRGEGDNPSIGLILCTDKNDAVVRYVLNEENKQIFASHYRLELPDEKKLAAELRREMEMLSSRRVPE